MHILLGVILSIVVAVVTVMFAAAPLIRMYMTGPPPTDDGIKRTVYLYIATYYPVITGAVGGVSAYLASKLLFPLFA